MMLKDLKNNIDRLSARDRLHLLKYIADSLDGDVADGDNNGTIAPAPTATSTIESIYTDGACSGNPGDGGWGVAIYYTDGSAWELGGGETNTTNNRMELQAAIAALEFLDGATDPVDLYTDSKYTIDGITKWVGGWKRKNWTKADGDPVKNRDLWERLDALNQRQNVRWHYVRGHSGNVGNDRCDAIARSFAAGTPLPLQQPVRSGRDRDLATNI